MTVNLRPFLCSWRGRDPGFVPEDGRQDAGVGGVCTDRDNGYAARGIASGLGSPVWNLRSKKNRLGSG